jgi:hypothetical protein
MGHEDAQRSHDETLQPVSRSPGWRSPLRSALEQEAKVFVPPRLRRHEPLSRITLVSSGSFGGSGSAGGGTFFGG